MANYGIKTGKGNVINGDVNNTVTTIDKRRFYTGITISISVVVVLIAALIIVLNKTNSVSKKKLLGTWKCDQGYVEFMSDGTVDTNLHSSSVKSDTYELLEEGYLKWGIYDAGWLQYDYTYWKVELSKDQLTLSLKDDPEDSITLYKE